MGKAKLDHLRALLADPGSRRAGPRSRASPASEADVDRLYASLEPAMKAAAAKSSRLIPGAAETAAELRALGVRIGSGTGYTREMMADILPAAAAPGLRAGSGGLRRRDAERPARAADDLEGADRARRLAGARLHQGR